METRAKIIAGTLLEDSKHEVISLVIEAAELALPSFAQVFPEDTGLKNALAECRSLLASPTEDSSSFERASEEASRTTREAQRYAQRAEADETYIRAYNAAVAVCWALRTTGKASAYEAYARENHYYYLLDLAEEIHDSAFETVMAAINGAPPASINRLREIESKLRRE